MKKITSIFLLIAFATIAITTGCKKENNNDDDNNSSNPVYGCMDPSSLNYNPSATIDDGSCIKPEAKVRSMVLVFTATGCQYCGQWGYKTFNALKEKYGSNIVPVAVHTSMGGDPMYNGTLFQSFLQSYSVSGVPNAQTSATP